MKPASPYVHQEYPKVIYLDGPASEPIVVMSEDEEIEASFMDRRKSERQVELPIKRGSAPEQKR